MSTLFKIMLGVGIGVVLWVFLDNPEKPESNQIAEIPVMSDAAPSEEDAVYEQNEQPLDTIQVPIIRADERVTRKPFGILINPKTSPVQPERFRGYHTGTDFEVFSEEAETEISIRAVCDGELIAKRSATGYGGVIVERCELGGETVTVVYGHLALESVEAGIGESVKKGESLGWLGAAGSTDTDGERKHLHLGIHRGEDADIRGYVSGRAELSQWIDPCLFFCPGAVSVPEASSLPDRVIQSMPFTVQAPGGAWHDPVFQNGCEEASILMAAYSKENAPLTAERAKREIRKLSKLSEELFGTAVDTSAEDTLTLFRAYTGRTDGELLDPVTDDEIRSVLAASKILIVPVNGRTLGNLHFTAPGPETHMLVITGYDTVVGEYITHDPGTHFGADYRYPEKRLLAAIRDYPTGNHLPIGSVMKRAIVIDRNVDDE